MVPWIWQNHGEIIDDPLSPTRLTLNQPETRAALQFILDLVQVDGVIPNYDASTVASQPDRFLAGSMAMYIDSRVFTPTMRETVTFDWDVAPLPQGQQPANVLHSDGYCMARASKVKEAAWEFIEYAMGEEGQIIASQLGRTVPSLRNVATSPAFLDPNQPPAAAHVWLENMESNMRLMPKVENWNAIERSAAVELEQAYLRQQTLDQAIANIDAIATNGFIPIR
jgi:multiple sugar transport system substrate-binding protein